jgi:hypothetical protein
MLFINVIREALMLRTLFGQSLQDTLLLCVLRLLLHQRLTHQTKGVLQVVHFTVELLYSRLKPIGRQNESGSGLVKGGNGQCRPEQRRQKK